MNYTTSSNSSSSELGGVLNAGSQFNITKCNFLNNEYNGSTNGIIDCTSASTFINCSIIENKGNYLFSHKPIIINCFLNENVVTRTVKDDPINFESTELHDSLISHYTTDKCSATYFYRKSKSYYEYQEDIKYIVKYVYKTSFFEAVNLSSLT